MNPGQYLKASSVNLADEKKALGAFYTPKELSDILCDWAIRSPNDTILEPSFGGCGFLKSLNEKLKILGAHNPQTQLFGCDIDKQAFNYLSETFGELVDLTHFIKEDYLSFSGSQKWPEGFSVAIGNPPYVPYQKIPIEARNKAVERLSHIGFKPGLRSSTWLYFVALSLLFLKPEGRMAWVLPGSFLQANYSKKFRSFLRSRFKRIQAFQVHERLFLYEGTDEQTIVLLGDGYDAEGGEVGDGDIDLTSCADTKELVKSIANWDAGEPTKEASCNSPVIDFFGQEERKTFESLAALQECQTLGETALIQIGLVTGANKFFVLSESRANELGISRDYLKNILSKFTSAPGLSFTDKDCQADVEEDKRCLLLSSETPTHRSAHVRKYLGSFLQVTGRKIDEVSTFKRKKVWCKTEDKNLPDAFFPVMHHLGPRLVLNASSVHCTNTIHRVFFRKKMSKTAQKLLSISMLSTFSQISAEIVGRKYGSGVLKHEPREAEKIMMLMPQIDNWRDVQKMHTKIDKLLRAKREDEARKEADHFVLGALLGDASERTRITLDNCLEKVRELRQPDRRKLQR